MNIKSTLVRVTAVSTMALAAVSAHAGDVATAIQTATADFKGDLTSVGGIAVGLGLVGIAFIAGIKLIKRAV